MQAEDIRNPDETSRWNRVHQDLKVVQQDIEDWSKETQEIVQFLKREEERLQTDVERALAEKGYQASRIQEFQSLSQQAAQLKTCSEQLAKIEEEQRQEEEAFENLLKEREQEVEAQREAFARVMARIDEDFEGHIRARRIKNGDISRLDKFITGMKQKGITRWWNDLEKEKIPSPQKMLQKLDQDALEDLGMTQTVEDTFRENLTQAKRRELAALRSPDQYVLECQIEGEEEYRDLEMLSGGRRVGVLLSLLLRTADNRPLVIDQPEDQLDNRFLFEGVLPALKELKGQRQIIVATHNANIVVNGDADQVIQLEATGAHGRPNCSGAIEKEEIRNAIVATVDGGDEAFRLRRLKYGF
jgi:DNA repair exonuclease SbcCD ATPase subunit